MRTYREDFEFTIYNILNEGDLSRRELFRWWLGEDAILGCGRCGREFRVAWEVEEEDEVLCEACCKRSPTQAKGDG